MKLTAIILFTACLAASANGFSQKITLDVKDAPIEKVFQEIKKQSGYTFVYRDEWLQLAQKVDLQLSNASINDALQALFKNQPLTYALVQTTVVVKLKDLTPLSNNGEGGVPPPVDVHGRVVNEKGEPVAGVTVTIKGTKSATATNDNGEFILKGVDNNATLIFTSVNMETFEIKVGDKTELQISLKTKITALGDVQIKVSTGYQQISKERFVGSYSQLDSADYNRRPGVNIVDRLDGTVTGLLFDKKDLRSGIHAQIRGLSTLGINSISPSTSPLIILDNFPYTGDLSAINQNDVETITVLKDAAAASIWGVQAGNGVIVITTKKGKYNQPLRISATSNIIVQDKPDLYYSPQMSVPDFIDVEQFLFSKGYFDANLNNTSTRPPISPVVEVLAKLRAGTISSTDASNQINSFKGQDVRSDLDKYVYRSSITQQYYLDIGGGNSVSNYQLSAGYNRTLPNIVDNTTDQFTINSNAGFRIGKRIEVSTGINLNQTNNKNSGFSLPNPLYPYAQLADSKGTHLAIANGIRAGYTDTAGAGKLLDWGYKPLDELNIANDKTISRFARINLGISYKVNDWITANVNYQYVNQFSNERNDHSVQSFFTRNLINLYTNLSQTTPTKRNPVPIGDIVDLTSLQSTSQNLRAQLNINKNFSARQNLTVLLAGEISESISGITNINRLYGYNDNSGAYQSVIDYVNQYPLYGRTSTATVPVGDYNYDGTTNRFVSLLANASYQYDNKYTFYASARRDGANVFGVATNNKWKPLWSAGGSWDINKESFYAIRWLPSLRFRVSYGYSGNVNNNLSGLPTINYASGTIFITHLTYANVGMAPNPNLKWEQVRTINFAMDFGLIKDRIRGSIDFFNKKSTDLISQVPFDPSSGVSLFTVNSASLKGNGFDFQVNSKNTNGIIKWKTNFGLSYAKMIVTKIYNGGFAAKDFINYAVNPSVGKVAYGISSYKWAGLDPTNGDPQGYLNGVVSKNYNGIANDSVGNQVFNGSAIPLYQGFLGNSLSWKGFTLSANITYRFDYYFRKPAINYNSLFFGLVQNSDYDSRWQQPGDEKHTNVPSMVYPVNSQRDAFYAGSEVNVLRADNIRLQDARLQYDFNTTRFKKNTIHGLQAYFYLNNINLIIWRASKTPYDPDYTGGLTSSVIIPPSKTWTLGVNLNL